MNDGQIDKKTTRYIMRWRARVKFFEKLDDLLSPTDGREAERCCGDFRFAESVLLASGCDPDHTADVHDVMRSRGGFCDCEILYNAVEESRLKAKHWKAEAAEKDARAKHSNC